MFAFHPFFWRKKERILLKKGLNKNIQASECKKLHELTTDRLSSDFGRLHTKRAVSRKKRTADILIAHFAAEIEYLPLPLPIALPTNSSVQPVLKLPLPPYRTSHVIFAFSLAAFMVLAFQRSVVQPHNWTYTHWLFSYEYGILKRGLAGAMLQWLEVEPTYGIVATLSKWNVALVFGLTGALLLRPTLKQTVTFGWLLFCLALLSSPGGLLHVGESTGRLNNIALVIMLAYLLVLPRLGFRAGWVLLALSGSLTVFLHEASFFLLVPFMIGAFVYTHQKNAKAIAAGLLAGFVVALVLACISIVSARSGMEEAAYLALLRSLYAGVHRAAVSVLFASVGDNIRLTLDHGLTLSNLWHHLIFGAIISPLLFTLWACFRDIAQALRDRGESLVAFGLLVASATTALALYPLGMDHFRWLSRVLMSLMLALVIMSRDPYMYALVSARFRANWVWIVVAIAVGALAGGAADYYSFGWARDWLESPR